MNTTPTSIPAASADDFRAQAQELIHELDNTASRVRHLTQQLIDMMPLLVALVAEDTAGAEVTA